MDSQLGSIDYLPMLNDNMWLTEKFNHGFAYWIYGIMGILSAIFMWKMVPETKGKTLEEIEHFGRKNSDFFTEFQLLIFIWKKKG